MKKRKIAIIGSGESLLGSGLGPAIDACDEVVRFSAFEIKGYEKDVGTRTDTWIGYMRPHPLLHTFRKVLFAWIGNINIQTKYDAIEKAIDDMAGVIKCKFQLLPVGSIKWAYKILKQNYGENPKPTTGFAGLAYYVLEYNGMFYKEEPADIYIAGFDGYASGNHYYSRGTTPVNVHKKHEPEKEMEVINKWIEDKEIHKLTPSLISC